VAASWSQGLDPAYELTASVPRAGLYLVLRTLTAPAPPRRRPGTVTGTAGGPGAGAVRTASPGRRSSSGSSPLGRLQAAEPRPVSRAAPGRPRAAEDGRCS
ncbi:hypothetical protein ABVB68_17545, partial [Streptomyces sp. NPDC096012]